MNQKERYKSDCYHCAASVELPAGSAETPQRLACPRCGAVLEIDWRCCERGLNVEI
jgi:uncharacterized paraquat-inducible protein A